MKFILSNFTHSSSLVTVKTDRYYSKSSIELNGLESIKKEREGLDWYCNSLGFKIDYKVNFARSYSKISVPIYDGYYSLKQNKYSMCMDIIERVYDHYLKIWGAYRCSTLIPIHGDFSLSGNILFNSEWDIRIIDWEHFCFSEIPFGFDFIFMCFESIYWDFINHSTRARDAIDHFVSLVNSSCFYSYKSISVLDIYEVFLNLIIYYSSLWGSQIGKISFLRDSKFKNFLENNS